MDLLAACIGLLATAWSYVTDHWQQLVAVGAFALAWRYISGLERQILVLRIERNVTQTDLHNLSKRVDWLLEENARRNQ
jgi:hypothetical protein